MQTKFDASTLHNNQALAAETQMVDDGSGTTQVKNYSIILKNKHCGCKHIYIYTCTVASLYTCISFLCI